MHAATDPEDQARALARIVDANTAWMSCHRESTEESQHALDGVREAVDEARDIGVPWGPIGDSLGLRRGAAYQRYRSRPNLARGA